ncbi:lytic transglycosylase domain-containing protein [Taibaiella helva]|uniref:lytic transglycosylase domain-containing protein n=1 Tax=Taibaiella helva TaxID=2301235 RepID=UPI001300817E|nr:lytic transglycosylase domain-containing protein [Taibaiella helva]
MKKWFCLMLFPALPLTAQAQRDSLPNPQPAVLTPDNKVFIRNYMSRFQHGMVNLQKDKQILMSYFDQSLAKNGIPKELKNLAVVESYLERRSISQAGAAGPWQLMEGTARGSGLIVSDSLDERFDVIKSTRVAMNLLKFLHKKYNDWNLVVAAYNAGSGRVDQAIRQAGGSNIYWDVEKYLPAETRSHVKKFMASSFALDGHIPEPGRPRSLATADSLAMQGMLTEPVTASFRLDVIAEKLDLTEAQLRQWNNDFEAALAKDGNTRLVLPRDKMPDFVYRKSEILKASIEKNITEQANHENEP